MLSPGLSFNKLKQFLGHIKRRTLNRRPIMILRIHYSYSTTAFLKRIL